MTILLTLLFFPNQAISISSMVKFRMETGRNIFVGWRLTPYPTYGTTGAGDLKIPGGAAACRGYCALRLGSPEKAQRAASGKKPLKKLQTDNSVACL
ncbi:TPA: hypothetical protein QH394_000594 [Klebsiella aerogenes]|nr:hypothetical protein [Klebsiella aerogenes]HDT5515053.1 hypothetical protein [Klebsiella aerogenes]